jgi:hypothetical protein
MLRGILAKFGPMGRLRHRRSASDTRGACVIDAWFAALAIE